MSWIERWTGLATLGFLTTYGISMAQGGPDRISRIPPPGVPVSATDRSALEIGISSLGKEIDSLKVALKGKPALLELLPDVQIYYNAARYALAYDEFFNAREIETAKTLLTQGMERATQLRAGQTPWTSQTGPVARGYLSSVDGSVQPYGIVVPKSYGGAADTRPRRLDFWFHGRGENLSEVNFIDDRQRSMGEFAPDDTFVLHPYGRYCNANRMAGEVDGFEAMEHIKKHYPIDNDRISVRGFSMGGAACWSFATHFPGLWAAAAPGAGFSETAGFLHIKETDDPPTWFERKLWHLYDSTDLAINLYNLPTVAYSGEVDGQRQAAEEMTRAMAAEGLTLTHVIGSKAGHWYEANAKKEVAAKVDALANKGNDWTPRSVKFTAWSLKYNRSKWVVIDAMGKEWERARVDADFPAGSDEVIVKSSNVSGLTLELPKTDDWSKVKSLEIDGSKFNVKAGQAVSLDKTGGRWKLGKAGKGLIKKHDLQGPIDDAFMSAFVMVRPTGQPMNAVVGAWTETESKHAIEHWRRQFRGEAPVKADTQITAQDIATKNLILWGDPKSNKVLARILSKLPIKWDSGTVAVGSSLGSGASCVPILIYPNPLNPSKYVVLNSGFTFREYDYLNNARQTPKLPDWAIVDVSEGSNSRYPGKILAANFFGEKWEVLAVPGAW